MHVGFRGGARWLGRVLWFATVFGCSVAAAQACAGSVPPPKEPEECDLQIVTSSVITSKYINPSETGEPRPVQVRLYQLKSDVRLQNSDFEQIWKQDAEQLKDDLVKVEEFPVYPNTRTEIKFERDDAAQFLVAAALFRNPTGKTWFKSFELPPAPSEGAGCIAAMCADGECDGGPVLNPKIYIWIDATRVDDGIEYADYFPEGRVVDAEPAAEPAPADAPAPGAPPAGPPAGDTEGE
jgi:type VI secretion system protein VasD